MVCFTVFENLVKVKKKNTSSNLMSVEAKSIYVRENKRVKLDYLSFLLIQDGAL